MSEVAQMLYRLLDRSKTIESILHFLSSLGKVNTDFICECVSFRPFHSDHISISVLFVHFGEGRAEKYTRKNISRLFFYRYCECDMTQSK